jgi:hypothetical protein
MPASQISRWLTPKSEIHTPFSSLAGEPCRGVAGYRQWRTDITDQFETWQLNIDEARTLEDDQLLAVGTAHVRGRGSGSAIEFDQPAAGLVDTRDGRLLRVRIYLSHEAAFEAAGLADG